MKKHTILLIIYIVISLGLMWLIFSFSSDSGAESSALSEYIKNLLKRFLTICFPDGFVRIITDNIRKIAHFTLYLCLGLAVSFSTKEWLTLFRPKRIYMFRYYMIAFAFCLLYAISDEIHQFFTPGRHCSITDVGIDSAGALLSCLLVYWFSGLSQKKART